MQNASKIKHCNNIFKIMLQYFGNKFIVSYFQKKVYYEQFFKKHTYFLKIVTTNNNKLVALLIIAGTSFLLNKDALEI